MGLQTDGIRDDGSRGDTAIFAIWNATRSVGPYCSSFGHEGSGHSCRIPYSWSAGRYYRYRVWKLGADLYGVWWGAWVKDTSTGRETYLGKIRATHVDGGSYITSVVNWIEYWGDRRTCDTVPRSQAYFTPPAGDRIGGVEGNEAYRYYSRWTGEQTRGDCTGGRATAWTFGGSAAFRLDLGGPR